MNWLAVDIGGANLKAADGEGFAIEQPFALWRTPDELPSALQRLVATAPHFDRLAVTMTGELADCFATKKVGVATIVDAAEQLAAGRPTFVYRVDGQFASPQKARDEWQMVAASNWYALASFACRWVEAGQAALLIDIGSTTCDCIPIAAGRPAAMGTNDTERLAYGELVYTGVDRTPVCAVVRTLPWRDGSCAVAAELFATMADVYRLLGDLPEDLNRRDTADGRPADCAHSHARLCRMICADGPSLTAEEGKTLAHAAAQAQFEQICSAAQRVMARQPRSPQNFIVSGSGEYLARRVATALDPSGKVISITEALGPEVSRVAPAHALACLACGAAL